MKQVERFNISQIEQELSFVSWCQENHIKTLLFDLDDTVCQTKPIFSKQLEECYELLSTTNIMSRKEWETEIATINDSLFETRGVNPNRWDFVTKELVLRYPLNENYEKRMKTIFSKIYTTPLPFIDGTEEALKFFRKFNSLEMGIVTHANEMWTQEKYKWLKLDRFLNLEDIYIIDQNDHKNEKTWEKALNYFRVSPEKCLVGGDSPRVDINPTINLGVRHCFLLKNNYKLWLPHQQEVDETKVRSITSLNDLRYLGAEMIFRK